MQDSAIGWTANCHIQQDAIFETSASDNNNENSRPARNVKFGKQTMVPCCYVSIVFGVISSVEGMFNLECLGNTLQFFFVILLSVEINKNKKVDH